MSLLTGLGVVVVVLVNTAIAVVATRFFRITLDTNWGAAIYTVLLVPIALLVGATVLSGLLGLGGGLGDRTVALLLTVGLPLALGITIDVFWMPPPEEIEAIQRRAESN